MVLYGLDGMTHRSQAYGLLAVGLREHWDLEQLPSIARGKRGKPLFPDFPQLRFNLSHSGPRALCALDRDEVGVDIQQITLKSLREDIGIVQQDVYLFSGSVADNIAYGKPDATREEIIEAARLAGAERFIMALKDGFDTYVGERGVKLSGGQKQRIAIARVFLKNPPILILDEATSALDNESEILVGQSLEKLAHGRTTLTIAHRLTTIKNYDRILVLGSEGIVESGTHDQLLEQKGVYYRLWNQLPGEDTL